MKHNLLLLCVIIGISSLRAHAETKVLSAIGEENVLDGSSLSEAETDIGKNTWGGKMIRSPFGLGFDLQTKYIWRGMEMMTEEAAPVIFPSINFSWKGLYLYAMGGYAVNGKYAEVDLGISYIWNNGISIGINDYYYPSVDSQQDEYLGGGKHTGH